ncbi:class I SAM-dependent methyltransferase [Formicincola oecophyllae]|uniref:Class I SAM-dependent methyltransferase n=1 Tax=Formicincola oecophyllae TaxID=2558361 RepID=A0A4Y6UAW8_9PROT|nr:cyclopropane-fatty-acyl-phospholipid synthase family protein [Formicincola oecophyllae]QDH14284.1 class I SAM-dependent methyltransferase [Formicincola oecophyllae]
MNTVFEHILKRLVQEGSLRVVFADGTERLYIGPEESPNPAKRLKAAVRFRTEEAQKAMLFNPGLAFGERYMSGEIIPLPTHEGQSESDALAELLKLLMLNVENRNLVNEQIMGTARRIKFAFKTLGLAPSLYNNPRKARRNVAHHYDLDARLYRLFLDQDMQYSCGYFPRGDENLEEAQKAKKHHIAAKLRLTKPGLRVLDIGCGWGGLALSLARDYGAHVTGITLSTEQLAIARQRARQEGLEHLVDFRLMDYRNAKGPFDRVVSVGMLEHVGKGEYITFFSAIKKLLKDDGVALIHSIGRKGGPGTTNPWIERYIFPGGYSPAVSEAIGAVEQSGLWVADCEILRLHYAKTLHHWRQRFEDHVDEVRALYDERFVRMFRFYLTASEMAFRVQDHMNFQLQLAPTLEAVPLTRDYMMNSRAMADEATASLVSKAASGVERS